MFTKVDGEWKLQAFANLGQGLGTNADAEARKVAEQWVQSVASGDKALVEAMLAPEFQIVRADGATYTAADYVKVGLPKIAKAPEIDRLLGTRYGDYLVVRYWLKIDATVDGAAMKQLAPRLTVFRKSGDKWLVVAHSNFAAVK